MGLLGDVLVEMDSVGRVEVTFGTAKSTPYLHSCLDTPGICMFAVFGKHKLCIASL